MVLDKHMYRNTPHFGNQKFVLLLLCETTPTMYEFPVRWSPCLSKPNTVAVQIRPFRCLVLWTEWQASGPRSGHSEAIRSYSSEQHWHLGLRTIKLTTIRFTASLQGYRPFRLHLIRHWRMAESSTSSPLLREEDGTELRSWHRLRCLEWVFGQQVLWALPIILLRKNKLLLFVVRVLRQRKISCHN